MKLRGVTGAFVCGGSAFAAASKGRILVIVSSDRELTLRDGKSSPTGYYFNELTVRQLVNPLDVDDPLSFKTYYNGSFSDSALPAGFTKNRVRDFFAAKGGRSTSLLFSDASSLNYPGAIPDIPQLPRVVRDVSSFSVAKVRGRRLFLGVAEDTAKGVTIWHSTDLVHWTESYTLPGTECNRWSNSSCTLDRYPRFLNKSGNNNNEIDPDLFYVMHMNRTTGVTSDDGPCKGP